MPVLPMDQVETAYYLRLMALDEPGVMAGIASILGDHGISIEAIQQKEPGEGETHVPLVMLTHRVREDRMNQAIAESRPWGRFKGRWCGSAWRRWPDSEGRGPRKKGGPTVVSLALVTWSSMVVRLICPGLLGPIGFRCRGPTADPGPGSAPVSGAGGKNRASGPPRDAGRRLRARPGAGRGPAERTSVSPGPGTPPGAGDLLAPRGSRRSETRSEATAVRRSCAGGPAGGGGVPGGRLQRPFRGGWAPLDLPRTLRLVPAGGSSPEAPHRAPAPGGRSAAGCLCADGSRCAGLGPLAERGPDALFLPPGEPGAGAPGAPGVERRLDRGAARCWH